MRQRGNVRIHSGLFSAFLAHILSSQPYHVSASLFNSCQAFFTRAAISQVRKKVIPLVNTFLAHHLATLPIFGGKSALLWRLDSCQRLIHYVARYKGFPKKTYTQQLSLIRFQSRKSQREVIYQRWVGYRQQLKLPNSSESLRYLPNVYVCEYQNEQQSLSFTVH